MLVKLQAVDFSGAGQAVDAGDLIANCADLTIIGPSCGAEMAMALSIMVAFIVAFAFSRMG
tara:strand:+ start:1461 stop:1643 length:183 start_codon:yes stop_codon:yes gene_type:complete